MIETQRKAPGTLAGLAGASLGIILALGASGAVEPPGYYVLLAIPIALSVLTIVRSTAYWREVRDAGPGKGSPQEKRYIKRFMIATGLYLVGMGGALVLFEQTDDPVLLAAIAMLPAIPAVAMALSFRSYVNSETDEYLRHRIGRSALGGLWLVLVVGIIYGFLETFAPVPHVPAWWVFPLWAVGMGIAQFLFDRDGPSAEGP
ncbi:hypothetical protein [Qipengyuania sp. JC766]|uniref:hypothetical protein n=1 Tax=Qipengyuania sp. JC766 TaxID=3232139 RepID=UPI00345853A2